MFLVGVFAPAISSVHAQTITSFDVPGAIATFPTSINPAGVITGSYFDSGSIMHRFVRDASGAFTSFDPPGSFSTDPTSINPAGEITGFYHDFFDARVAHGFVRSR